MRCDYREKFGIPRQSGRVPQSRGEIVFEPEYRNADAFRGLEGFSHLWLIWDFSLAHRENWSPTVRPPRLGGNARMGVFATRSPFRPNPIGLSCVTIEEIRLHTDEGPVIVVGGADLMDGTPIFDIKPYLPQADSHPDARGGFSADRVGYGLQVEFPEELEARIKPGKREALRGLLADDPRPGYQDDPGRVYGVAFGEHNVRFRVCDGVLRVMDVEDLQNLKG